MSTGHRQLEHTADLALALWAPSETALLEEGARAVVELMTAGHRPEPRASRHVRLEVLDAEDRLVQWLNEIIYLATAEGFLFASAELHTSEGGLEAEVSGEADAADRIATELKSVTYHDLELRKDREGTWHGRVVIDV